VGLSIRNKLLIAFGALVGLTALIGWVGLSQSSAVAAASQALYSAQTVGTGQVAALTRAVMQMRLDVAAHVFEPSAPKRTALEAEIAKLDQEIDRTLLQIRTGPASSVQLDQLKQFEAAWTRYKEGRDTIALPNSKSGLIAQAEAYVNGDGSERDDSRASGSVAGSSDQMRTQVDEMSAQATELAANAHQLQTLVARFEVGAAAKKKSSAGRRRAGEEQRTPKSRTKRAA
jgi:hypothetical protein